MRPEDVCRSYNNWIIMRRWAATWLDFLLLGALLFGLMSAFGEKYSETAVGLWLLLALIYYPLLEGLTGRTFGKWVCRLTVVNEQGKTPGIGKAIIRTLLRLVEVNPFVMGGVPAGIAVLASSKRQRLGDMAAKTYVLMTEDLVCLTTPLPTLPAYDLYGNWHPSLGTPPPLWNPPTYQGQSEPLPSAQSKGWAVPGACLFSLAALGLIAGGILGLQTANRTRRPITMSCEQFLKNSPREGWYHLTECTPYIPEAAYQTYRYQSRYSDSDSETSDDATITDAYVPVYAAGDEEEEKTSLLLSTDEENTLRLVSEMRKIDDNDEAKMEAWVLEHYAELTATRDITGTIQSDFEVLQSTRDEINKLQQEQLTRDYVIIKEGDTPMAFGPIAAIVGGVVVGFLAFGFWIIVAVSATQRPTPQGR